jgi:hypothetical protein
MLGDCTQDMLVFFHEGEDRLGELTRMIFYNEEQC